MGMLRSGLRLAGSVILCVTLWTYPLGELSVYGQRAEQIVELVVCERGGRRTLELRRVLRRSNEELGGTISTTTEVVVPWGAESVPSSSPPPRPSSPP